MSNDQAVIERLQEAVSAYTANVHGRPDSLDALLLSSPPRRSRRRSMAGMAALATGVAAAVAAIVFAATSLSGPATSLHPAQQAGPRVLSTTHIAAPTSARYPASQYFLSRRVTRLTQKELVSEPVIVRTADLKVVRVLPIALMSPHLTADGSRVFGYYAGSVGDEGTANSDSTNPAVKTLVHHDTSGHAVYYDFATGDVAQLGSAAWPGISGMTVTPDGRTVAYSRIVTTGGEHSIIRIVDVASGKGREFAVPKHRQSLALALSPDATKLAFTETDTGNILFFADLSQPDPAATARAVIPPQPCRKGAYDYPTWLVSGLYAAQECEPDSRGLVSQVVQLDPASLQPVGAPLAPLPDGGVTQLAVATAGRTVDFFYMGVRSPTPYDHGDQRIVFRNNEMWRIGAGKHVGHRTGLMWSW